MLFSQDTCNVRNVMVLEGMWRAVDAAALSGTDVEQTTLCKLTRYTLAVLSSAECQQVHLWSMMAKNVTSPVCCPI